MNAPWEGDEPAGVMSGAEVTRQIKALWKNMEELRGDLRGFRAELVEHGKALAKIETGIERLVASLVLIPPRETCVRAEMRITALEETVEDIAERGQCQGYKNDGRVEALENFKKTWEPRLLMGFGIVLFLQIAMPLAVKFLLK